MGLMMRKKTNLLLICISDFMFASEKLGKNYFCFFGLKKCTTLIIITSSYFVIITY